MSLNTLKKRAEALEGTSKPRTLSTLADFVLWVAHGCLRPVEWDPRLRSVMEEFVRTRWRRAR